MHHLYWTLTALVIAGGARSAEPEKFMTVTDGQLPIILSAPHGGRRLIPDVPPRKGGEGVESFLAERDDNTAELAELVAAEMRERLKGRPYLVIARFDRKCLDVNRAENSALESENAKPYYRAYHKALEDFTKELQQKWKRGLLLDIHGQGGRPNTLCRGTLNGQTVELMVKRFGKPALIGPKSLFGAIESAGCTIFPATASDESEDKRYQGGYIVRTYGSHQGSGIDAIQLEVGSDLRRKAALPKTASVLAEAIEVFCREYLREGIPPGK